MPPPASPGPAAGLVAAIGSGGADLAIMAGLIAEFLRPGLLAATASGVAIVPMPPLLPTALAMASCKAPARPIRGLATKFGIGITRSPTG